MQEVVRVHKGIRLFSRPLSITAKVTRQWGLAEGIKGCYICLHVPRLLMYRAFYITGYGNRIKNKSHDCHGSAKAQGSKAKPTSLVSVA
jgi:hypothetical protein